MSMTCHKLPNLIFFLFADDTCLFCQHKVINKIENQLNEDFCNNVIGFCNWIGFIHFGEDKAKSILFVSKFKRKNIKKFDILKSKNMGIYKLNKIL